MATGEGEVVRRPANKILLARDGYERYLDNQVEPADRLARKLLPGVEEAWDSLDEDSHVELLEYDGMGGFPGGGWRWTISACDLDDGRRIYTEMQSGNLPQPGIFLIAVTNQPGADADTLVVEAFHRSEHGQFLQDRWDPDTGEWKDENGDG